MKSTSPAAQRLSQRTQLRAEARYLRFKRQKPLLHFGRKGKRDGQRFCGSSGFHGYTGFPGKKLSPAEFLLAGLPRQAANEGTGGPGGEFVENLFNLGEVRHRLKPFRVGPQSRDCLRTAKQELSDQSTSDVIERIVGIERLPEFRNPRICASEERDETTLTKLIGGGLDFTCADREHGRAIIALVAGVHQGVHRKRIDVGCSEFFFDQASEYADFQCGERRIFREGRGNGDVCTHGIEINAVTQRSNAQASQVSEGALILTRSLHREAALM